MKRVFFQKDTLEDALAFWQLLRQGQGRVLLRQPTENNVIQLFRYVITGVSSFLVDYLLLFGLEAVGVHYLPAAAGAFAVGIVCNFFLTKFFAFKAVDPTVGPGVEVLVFVGISVGGLVLTMLLMYFFTGYVHLHFMLSKLISSVLVFFWNFLGRKIFLYPGKVHEVT